MIKVYISGVTLQILGLSLDIIGMVLLAIGALDKSSPTWGDIGKVSPKTRNIYHLAWLGVVLAAMGFVCQIIGLKLN